MNYYEISVSLHSFLSIVVFYMARFGRSHKRQSAVLARYIQKVFINNDKIEFGES